MPLSSPLFSSFAVFRILYSSVRPGRPSVLGIAKPGSGRQLYRLLPELAIGSSCLALSPSKCSDRVDIFGRAQYSDIFTIEAAYNHNIASKAHVFLAFVVLVKERPKDEGVAACRVNDMSASRAPNRTAADNYWCNMPGSPRYTERETCKPAAAGRRCASCSHLLGLRRVGELDDSR